MITVKTFTGVGVPRRPVSGIPVNTAVNTTLKIAFQLNTSVGPGATFFLCAGTLADFNAGNIGLELASVTRTGTQTLTIIDTDHLAGKLIYIVERGNAIQPATLEFTIDVE